MNSTASILSGHLRAHNQLVLVGSASASIFSAFGWLALYGVSYASTLFALTAMNPDHSQIPPQFDLRFFSISTALLVIAAIGQWLRPNEEAVDGRPVLVHALDLILFLPRFTLSAGFSLSALVSLRASDIPIAADLLERLHAAGKIPLQQITHRFPSIRSQNRIIHALTVSKLIDLRSANNLTWLYLSPLLPKEFHFIKQVPDESTLPAASNFEKRVEAKILQTEQTRDLEDVAKSNSPPP